MPAVASPLAEAWRALGAVAAPPLGAATLPALELRGSARFPPSPFALEEIAVASIGAALLAAAELAQARGARTPVPSLEQGHALLAFRSERSLQAGRSLPKAFAPLSRFAATADGHLRMHANYRHHRAALMRALGDPPDEPAALEVARQWRAAELEQAIVAAGGAAAAVRSEQEWHAHPQARATGGEPLLDLELGEAAAGPLAPAGELPCTGVRVLDFTRVIAGPVGTRMLAALGAEVLRIDPPHLPELELQLLDGAVGKRSALLDLRARADRAALERLIASADVLVQGYRPGALAAFGLDRGQLAARHPHVVTVTLAAWGDRGPWSGRRGFDSLVQAACGIAVACGSSDEPGALPVQALDHATGYLIAAAALRGLSLRARCGRAAHAYLALARTAGWIMRHRVVPTVAGARPEDRERYRDRYLVEVSSPAGPLRCVAPPGALDGRTLSWPRGVPQPGADPPQWSRAGARQRPRASV